MGFKEFLRSRSLRAKDGKRTRAAELTLRESIYPITLVTVLFFLWGFSYGLLDTLNKHFQNTLHITKARSAGLQGAYFGAYPLASLGHANWILRHYGYRATFIWGLFLYGVGAFIAIPCIKAQSFGGFCTAIAIVGSGLGSLETAANPYITVCGPPKYSELRINISQAFNGIGTVIAPVLGSYVFFTFDDSAAVENVQWVYVAIGVFVFLLALAFFVSTIPEITDADMAFQAQEETHANTNSNSNNNGHGHDHGEDGHEDGDGDEKPFWKQYRLFHAAGAQFCYTGAQIAIASYFINYVRDTQPWSTDASAARFLSGAQGAFAGGRFFGSFLMNFVRPRWVFLVFLALCIVFVGPATDGGSAAGWTGMSLLYVVLFFESICFPTIVALGMRGLGRHTKRGSGWIVAGVSGGAVVPPLTGVAADALGSTARAMVVPLVFFVAALSYAVAVNFVPAYRDTADAFSTAKIGTTATAARRHDEEGGGIPEKMADEKLGEADHVSTTAEKGTA